MQFSKLRLLGFKSFVDPVEIDILSGLTGIVGPNGCGKSNLLEALRWAMGENRPSSMRGGAMDDVIFAGAGTRVAKNFAEVLIGLNNVNKDFLGLDSQNGTVEIVRRVTRDIGSSYRLNGKDVRAKDISMLFADSSTGSHSPSLVRQGQITELINAHPKSRRRLLEEAAGIAGLYQRRHEAELKLKSSEANMARLQEVVEQLENQIKVLSKQAKQASKYKELAEAIRTNESFLFCKKWSDFDTKIMRESEILSAKTKLVAEAELELISCGKIREKLEDELPGLRNDETRAASGLQRLIVEKEGIESDQLRATNNIVELETRVEETGSDYERQNNLINDAKEVVDRLNWELAQLKKLAVSQNEVIEESRKEASIASAKLVEDELKLDHDSESFTKLSVRFQNIEKQIEKAKTDLEKIVFDISDFDNQASKLVSEIEAKQLNQADATDTFKKCKQEAAIAEDSLEKAEKLRAEAVKEELQKRVDHSDLDGKLAALRSERHALKGIINSATEQSDKILDNIRVVKGYEMALGAAFSDDIKAPIISSNDKSGWFELPEIQGNISLPDGAEMILDKVTAPLEMKRSLSNIGVVESYDGSRLQEFLKPGQKLVSKDGSLWRWDGYCCMGTDNFSEVARRFKQENRLMDLMSEIENTEKQLELVLIDLNRAQDKSSKSEEAETLARNVRSNCDEKESKSSRILSTVEFELNILKSKLHTLADNSAIKIKDKEVLEKEIIDLSKALKSLGDLGSHKHILEGQRSVVEQSRELMAEKRALFDQVRRDSDIRSKRITELNSDLSNWEQRFQVASDSAVELEKRKITVGEELKQAKLLPESLLNRRATLAELVKEADKKKLEISQKLSEKENRLRSSKNEEKDLGQKVSKLREDVVRLTTIKENAELNLNDLRKIIIEETSTEPYELINNLTVSLKELPDISTIEHTLFSLKNNRDALGAVNLRAAEDSQELAEEWKNLCAEKADMETAIKKLRSAITKLNSEGRTRLLGAFKEVNMNFGELFKTLFGGGSAKLTFVESDDPLEAGLEIICQPPGKKLSTLSLLSGGEQTLTALALIFAVFKANPSPICVLDEVDAPLDDANVERFCGLLDEMTRKTQTRFMIITHHPLTMSRMDRLYGVTMVERGVSQLVSVDLNKAEQLLDN